MTAYFAYGANMDPLHMAQRCPEAVPLGRAELPDHVIGIAAGGFGTMRAAAGGRVVGVLWDLSPAHLAALDEFEGVAEGFYHRDSARVHTADGEVVEAMIYRPSDDAPGSPAPGYLERIIEVAEMLQFPSDYVASLRELLPPQGQQIAGG